MSVGRDGRASGFEPLYASDQAFVGYLDEVDPEAARWVRSRYACSDHSGLRKSCGSEVVVRLN